MIEKTFNYLNEKFGSRALIIKAIEELSELQQVLCHYLNKDVKDGSHEDINYVNIASEIADVKIVTSFLERIFEDEFKDPLIKFSDIIESQKEYKLKRALKK